jgi:hypothetical protein
MSQLATVEPLQSTPVGDRHLGLRLALLAGIAIIWTSLLLIVATVSYTLLGGTVTTVADVVDAAHVLLLLAVVCLGTQVGYRVRDGWLLLVPLANVYYLVKVLWRTTSLPYRYWPQRPEASPSLSSKV